MQSAARVAEETTAYQAGRVTALEASLMQRRKASGNTTRKTPKASVTAPVSQWTDRREV